MKRLTGLILSVLVLGSFAQALTTQEVAAHGFHSKAELAKYLSIAKVQLKEVPVDTHQMSSFVTTLPAGYPGAVALGNDLITAVGPVLANSANPAAWITLGQKAWQVVVANRPVLNVTSARVSVLPVDKTQWARMSGWQAPVARSFTLTATNLMGLEVVSQTYTISYNYGGQLNGKGAYLANATIIPSSITVAWGYTLDSSVEVGQIVNLGNTENPVPGIQLQLKRSIKTILKQDDDVDAFFIKGTGGLQQITP